MELILMQEAVMELSLEDEVATVLLLKGQAQYEEARMV